MNRKQIRDLARKIMDEETEAPEGLLFNIDIDVLINIAQGRVEMELIPYIPREFRKPVLISLVAAKPTYNVVTDLLLTDFLVFENIFHNESGKKPQGLQYIEPDQLYDYWTVGETGQDPRVWLYEEKDTIGIYPIPTASLANRLKGFYFYEVPDLNEDEDKDHDPASSKYSIPAMPKAAHPLIAVDTVRLIHLVAEEESSDIDRIYATYFSSAINALSIEPSLGSRVRGPLSESVR